MRSTTRSTTPRRRPPTRRSRCRCARLSDRVAAAPSAAWPGGAAASPPDGLVHPAVRRRCVQVLVAAAADRSQLLLKAEALAPRCGVSPHISPSLPQISRPRCGIGAVEEHSRGRALRYSAALGCVVVLHNTAGPSAQHRPVNTAAQCSQYRNAASLCPAVFTQKHNPGPKTHTLRQSRKR